MAHFGGLKIVKNVVTSQGLVVSIENLRNVFVLFRNGNLAVFEKMLRDLRVNKKKPVRISSNSFFYIFN